MRASPKRNAAPTESCIGMAGMNVVFKLASRNCPGSRCGDRRCLMSTVCHDADAARPLIVYCPAVVGGSICSMREEHTRNDGWDEERGAWFDAGSGSRRSSRRCRGPASTDHQGSESPIGHQDLQPATGHQGSDSAPTYDQDSESSTDSQGSESTTDQ